MIYELSVYLKRHLTLDNLSRSNQGHMTFKRLYLLNGESSYQILHETHIVNHIWFSLPHDMFPWVALKGQIKIIGC